MNRNCVSKSSVSGLAILFFLFNVLFNPTFKKESVKKKCKLLHSFVYAWVEIFVFLMVEVRIKLCMYRKNILKPAF